MTYFKLFGCGHVRVEVKVDVVPASPPSAGLLGELPSVGAADEDDDLVEEYLEDFEESGSTDFVDFEEVKVSDGEMDRVWTTSANA